MGKTRCSYRVLLRKLRERVHFKDTGVDGRLIFKWIFKKWFGAWNGLIWLGIGHGVDWCECGSIKCEEY
jgi:hypothetical protein